VHLTSSRGQYKAIQCICIIYGFLLLEPIEQTFDRKDICFLYNSLNNELTAKVLNHSLKTESLASSNPPKTYSMTYGDPLMI
jgi:hypothetical protein